MKYVLRLYIMGRTPLSQRAITNAKNICQEDLKNQYALEVIDLQKHIELAEDEKIFATPTFEKKLPLPLKRIIGDLNDKEKVLVGLDLVSSEE